MTAPSQTPLPAKDYAYWPFQWLSVYGQIARDFGRCGQALSQSTDAMETVRAEADLGVRLFDDMTRAYWNTVLAPWTAMASAMARQATVSSLPLRSGRSGDPARG